MVAAAIAIAAANSPWSEAYRRLFEQPLGFSPIPELHSVKDWINDALMAVFFFTIGLEIKREALVGNLAHPARRRLPVLAAICGMACPALVYLFVTRHHPALARGWAIPAATDIAFAMGAIALLGKRVPPALRLFLLTVAVVDDLGAVAIIALVYTAHVDPLWLGLGALIWLGMVMLNRAGRQRALPYVAGAVLLWWCVLHSGVHPTIAGVLAALAVPLRLPRLDGQMGHSLALRLEHGLAPWCAFAIAPLFGLANAGVEHIGKSLSALGAGGEASVLSVGIGAGLVLGKPVGVFGATWLAEATGFAQSPEGTSRTQMLGLSMLAGIGFTMSLFIGALAFPEAGQWANAIRLGILAGSLASALLGMAVLRFARSA